MSENASGARGAASRSARFVVRLDPTADGQLHVTASGPAGSAETGVTLPDLAALLAVDTSDGDDAAWRAARRVGVALFEAVFAGPVLRLFEESRHLVDETPLPVDLVLGDERLSALPWELLRDPEADRFLALAERLQFSRVLAETPSESGQPATLRPANLRVSIVAPVLDEAAIATAQVVGADARVDVALVAATPGGAELSSRPQVVQILVAPAADDELPPAPLLVVPGDARLATRLAQAGRAAVVALPASMPDDARGTFLAELYAQLARGVALDRATTLARRAVATAHTTVGMAWAAPVLVTRAAPTPLATPTRRVAGVVGERVKHETVSWMRDTASGIASSVALFLVGLVLYRVGFSQQSSLSFSVLSPYSLFTSFKSLILALSTYQDSFLLVSGLVLLAVTVGIFYLWLRDRANDPETQLSLVAQMRGPFASLRSATFVSVLTIAVLGAYAYQQYLWHVALPIPDDAIGIAITRDVAAASFKGELADALFSQGQTQRIVIRELPVNFDASDTGKARKLGQRINAKAVVIYRADAGATDGQGKYAAYVVFTDPEIGLEVGGQPQEAGTAAGGDAITAASGAQQLVRLREGVEAPALRTDTLAELVSASAGIIAYHEDRSREAIEQLELALPHDQTAAANGIVSFYLGNAYQLDAQDAPAAAAFERAIGFYERRQAAGPLGPQDELVLLKSYLQRGRIASFASDYAGALVWYQQGVGLRDDLLARAGGLDRPSDVHATYARLYAQLADAYRAQHDTENVNFWTQRARDEASAIGAAARPDDARAFVEQSSALVFAGDCVGALASIDTALAIDPNNADAVFNASVIQYEQGRSDLAEQSLQRVLELRPDDVGARLQLANLRQLRAFLNGDYFEPAYLTQAADLYQDVLKLDPTNLVAHRQLAEMAEWRGTAATFDMTALLSGDAFSVAKSQAAWEIDPTRRQAGLDAFADAIEQRRVLASELRPGDLDAQLALAYAYFNREKLLYDALYPKTVGGHSELTLDSDQLLADAAEIHKAAEPVLADGSGATRLQQLQAWQVLLQSLDREWGWQLFYLQDQAHAQTLADQFRTLAQQAVASIEAQPLTAPDQQAVGAQIYLMRALVAQVIDNDAQAADDARSKFSALYAQSTSGQQAGTQLAQTLCGEERERVAGEASAAKGDWTGAQTHAEAALVLNPRHVPSLLDLAAALYQQGDLAGATAHATQAVQLAPNDATALERLALYQTAAGAASATAADGAWARFVARAAQLPAQERMALLGVGLNDLDQLARQPEHAAAALAAVPLYEQALVALPADAQQTYQAPQLASRLARVALLAGDAPTAERLLRGALQTDPHQPAARALLALAVLAQGRDASAEITAASAEVQDELWQNSGTPGPADVRSAMTAEIAVYVARFPDAASAAQGLKDALAAAGG